MEKLFAIEYTDAWNSERKMSHSNCALLGCAQRDIVLRVLAQCGVFSMDVKSGGMGY